MTDYNFQQMILIVDAGSTKTDWATQQGQFITTTNGINPATMEPEDIRLVIREELIPALHDKPEKLFFYGAGCIGTDNKNYLLNILQNAFPDCSVNIDSDLLGASRALLKNKPGIVAVLGTGSSCGLFDGATIAKRVPSLGYMMDDVGSGSYLGKMLIMGYFKKKMPSRIWNAFDEKYKLSLNDVIHKLYHQPHPSQFLGSIVYFLDEHIQSSYIINLIRESFNLFFEDNISPLGLSPRELIYFSGAVAHKFSDILTEVVELHGFKVGEIIKSPIMGLTDYHREIDKNE